MKKKRSKQTQRPVAAAPEDPIGRFIAAAKRKYPELVAPIDQQAAAEPSRLMKAWAEEIARAETSGEVTPNHADLVRRALASVERDGSTKVTGGLAPDYGKIVRRVLASVRRPEPVPKMPAKVRADGFRSIEETAKRLRVTEGSLRHAGPIWGAQGLAVLDRLGHKGRSKWSFSPSVQKPLPRAGRYLSAKQDAEISIHMTCDRVILDAPACFRAAVFQLAAQLDLESAAPRSSISKPRSAAKE